MALTITVSAVRDARLARVVEQPRLYQDVGSLVIGEIGLSGNHPYTVIYEGFEHVLGQYPAGGE